MILINLALFLVSLFVLLKFSNYAIRYSSRLSKALHFPEFIVSFFIIAIISILPEATVSIISAIKGNPQLGFGTLLGSNVTDLTLVFGIIALLSTGGVQVKSKILSNKFFYLILLLFPLVLGLDGKYSRIDGSILVLSGAFFFIRTYIVSKRFRKKYKNGGERTPFLRNLILLILSFAILLAGAFFTVKFALNFANEINLPAILIGITILGIGTCLPELTFSIKAVRKNHDELALGDLLGTVIADATIVLGIVILICPFNYNVYNIYITGGAMFLAGLFVTIFMKTDKELSKKEGLILLLFYLLFVFLEFFANHVLF